MDRKINVFIGGSSESLNIANKVAGMFNKLEGFNSTVWNKDTFNYNESFLNSLVKASLIYDFGIFIASNDDVALIRDSLKDIPRDNTIFEYGLFLGALGNKKTFLMQEESCQLPTDILGYTTPRYNREYEKEQWTELIRSVSAEMKMQFQKSEIQVLPSTSLAIGYFNSFLSKISKHIFYADGSILNKAKTEHKEVVIKVKIPNELSDDVGAKAFVYYKQSNLQMDEVGESKRPFPVRFYKNELDGELSIVDIPTTLNAIKLSINFLIPDTGIGKNNDILKLERKELENFKRTLEHLVEQNDYSRDIVKIEWMN